MRNSVAKLENNDATQCLVCGKIFMNIMEYTHHLKTHLPNQEQGTETKNECEVQLYECPICLLTFSNKKNLVAHKSRWSKEFTRHIALGELHKKQKTVHDELKAFHCTLCNKSFGFKGALNIHINAIHNKSFTCTLCDKSFTDKRHLLKHMNLVHNILKPCSCIMCDKSFAQKQILTAHVDAIHNKPQEFSCATCKKSFKDKRQLTSHRAAVHQSCLPTCTYCNKSFSSKQYLAKHMEVKHNKPFTFACRFCKIPVPTHNGLEKHERLCDSRRTFNAVLRCPKCKRYYRKDKLNQHIILCEYDAKTHSLSDSLPKHTGTGTSHPIVITPIPADTNASNGYLLETQTSPSALIREAHTTGANYASVAKQKDPDTNTETQEPFMNYDTLEAKDNHDVSTSLETKPVLEIKPE